MTPEPRGAILRQSVHTAGDAERHCGGPDPRATTLYRLFEAHFDEVRGQWAERHERWYGFWRSFVDDNRVRVEPEDQPTVERLARYIMRPPISLEPLAWDGVGEVRYHRKRGHEGSGLRERQVEAFGSVEFLARVIMYIPEPRRHLVRYCGWYSNSPAAAPDGQRLAGTASRWAMR